MAHPTLRAARNNPDDATAGSMMMSGTTIWALHEQARVTRSPGSGRPLPCFIGTACKPPPARRRR
jgi:hypothetical protein